MLYYLYFDCNERYTTKRILY